MSTSAALRTQPVDRRRLSAEDRATYQPGPRNRAVSRARAYKGRYSAAQKRREFATEQKPGTGGFTQGRSAQQRRLRDKGNEERRAKSFRPENSVGADIYKELAS